MGNVKVDLENTLNKGLYTEIKSKETITDELVKKIEDRMRQIVELDLPITKKLVSREEGLEIMKREGMTEKAELLADHLHIKDIKFYNLNGYMEFFYGYMAPSTGYIKVFELRKYRRGVLLRFPESKNPDQLPEYIDQVKLYEAFGERATWARLQGISYVTDLNRILEAGHAKDLVLLSEALHEKRIAEIAETIKQEKKRIILIPTYLKLVLRT